MMKYKPFDECEPWSRVEKRQWLTLLVLGTSAVYASRTSVPLLIPSISAELGWTKADSGAILSSFFWGYTLTQVLGGYVADRVGGEKVLLAAGVGWSCVTLLMPLVLSTATSGLGLVIAARIAHGAFQGVHFPGMSSLAGRQLADRERASFFSLATSGCAFGTLMTGTFGSFILSATDWRTVFYVIGLICCLWTYAFYRQTKTGRVARTAVGRDGGRVPWGALFTRPAFWALVTAHACQNNCFFTLVSWLPTYFHETYPQAPGWVVNMVPWLFTVPCTFFGKWLTERLVARGHSVTNTRKIVETTCLLTQVVGLLFLDISSSLEGALLCIVITIGATGFHNSAVVVNPGDLAPRHAGSVFGLMNTVGSIPGFVGVYAAGEMLDRTHSWSTVFRCTAAVNIVGCCVYAMFASGNPVVVVHNI